MLFRSALAAATQLDGGDDAITRARDAANNTFANASSSFTNQTRFANDRAGRPITELSFKFYDDYISDSDEDHPGTELASINDPLCDGLSDGADAEVVEVTVNARRVFYALTPLVGAFSDNAIGRAMAGLQSATCNVAPLMFCVPEVGGVADRTFPTDADIGKGLKLHMNANQADPWAPGNFGFLDIDYVNSPAGNPNRRLGFNSATSGCIGDVINSDTGVRDPESTALNTRFDIYPSSGNFACDAATGDFCPAQNTRKDFIFAEVKAIRVRTTAPIPATPQCGTYDSRAGWTANSAAKSLPEDTCFTGSCNVLGDGVWTASNYMATHHPGATPSDLGAADWNSVTRYEAYKWELEDPATRLAPQRLSSSYTFRDQGANRTYSFTNICAYPKPIIGTGVVADDDQKDRRVLTVAAVDCTGLNGSHPVDILRWVDLFLVKPASATGADKEFFTEIIGPARKPNGDSGFQYFGRKKAVLIR